MPLQYSMTESFLCGLRPFYITVYSYVHYIFIRSVVSGTNTTGMLDSGIATVLDRMVNTALPSF